MVYHDIHGRKATDYYHCPRCFAPRTVSAACGKCGFRYFVDDLPEPKEVVLGPFLEGADD